MTEPVPRVVAGDVVGQVGVPVLRVIAYRRMIDGVNGELAADICRPQRDVEAHESRRLDLGTEVAIRGPWQLFVLAVRWNEPAGRQASERARAADVWQESGLVFTTSVGTPFESHNLRREFRKVTAAAGLGSRWVPNELRTSFVSMMSYHGVPVEEIARLAGHASSRTTEVIYRRELRPVITTGAEVMDQIFRPRQAEATELRGA